MTKLLASVRDPSAYPNKRTLFFTWLLPSVQTALPHRLKVPSSGFGYPLDGVSPFILGSDLSTPHAHGLHSSGLCSNFVAGPKFPCILPLVRFSTKPLGLVPTLQRIQPTRLAVPSALSFLFRRECGLCPHEFLRLPGFPPLDIRRSLSLLPALLTLLFLTSEEANNWSPKGFLPAAWHVPSFEGRQPAWRSRSTVICHPFGG